MSKEFDESRRLFGEMFPDAPKEEVTKCSPCLWMLWIRPSWKPHLGI